MSEVIAGEIVNQSQGVRFTKHDEKVVLLLEAAFNNAFNITEACQYAGISRETYYNWLADDNIFSNRMSFAQSALNKKAKETVALAIQGGDAPLALRYLTLRDPDFKPKAEVTNPLELAETRVKLKDFFDDIKQHDPSGEPPTTDGTVVRVEVSQTPTDIS